MQASPHSEPGAAGRPHGAHGPSPPPAVHAALECPRSPVQLPWSSDRELQWAALQPRLGPARSAPRQDHTMGTLVSCSGHGSQGGTSSFAGTGCALTQAARQSGASCLAVVPLWSPPCPTGANLTTGIRRALPLLSVRAGKNPLGPVTGERRNKYINPWPQGRVGGPVTTARPRRPAGGRGVRGPSSCKEAGSTQPGQARSQRGRVWGAGRSGHYPPAGILLFPSWFSA